MATFAEWLQGARPRTLPASVAPVLAATGLALASHRASAELAVLAGVVSLGLQVGVNYANDYSDGVRGTDETRVGPLRLVGSKLATPDAVKRAAFASFGVAAIAGLIICALVNWWLVLVGVVAIPAAWFYTGGRRPYGYAGFGELFVFVFFGLVATVGTYYIQVRSVSSASIELSIAFGAFITAILVANNLRDIPGDAQAGKKTLAVRMGDRASRIFYGGLMVLGLATFGGAIGWSPWLLSLSILVGLTVWPIVIVARGAIGRDLIAVLAGTSRVTLVAGILALVVFWVR